MSIPKMNYPQYRKARRLTRGCCNNVGGNCLLLDDGEECICVQSISYSLLCRWFRAAVLPLDESLCATLLHQENRKKCVRCGELYVPKSNRAKYCPNCARQEKRKKTRDRVRRHRAGV
ncbi:cysteine-rich VLP domain-containing protein [uncultured Oscillibacter sp.]|uniref:cysteine-rich VLP domain-containing protein n=1 Tax=uncultured Oscillibacter sp. TaxID=876091 RepID=UPI002607F477|nr:cysteine-rich VLP domain-containing protein [uncultured Oscillibacter sp.]